MRRILAAFLILSVASTISFISMKTLEKKLDALEKCTISLAETQKKSDKLYRLWKSNEKTFAIILNEDKFKNLSRQIFLTTSLNGENLLDSCNEILFEISIIRETQQISLENIL